MDENIVRGRQKAVRQEIVARKLAAMLVMGAENVTYLTGFLGHFGGHVAVGFIHRDQPVLIKIGFALQAFDHVIGEHAVLQFVFFHTHLVGTAGGDDDLALAAGKAL